MSHPSNRLNQCFKQVIRVMLQGQIVRGVREVWVNHREGNGRYRISVNEIVVERGDCPDMAAVNRVLRKTLWIIEVEG